MGPAIATGGTAALVYLGAALAEIAGCFAFWAWLRLDKSPLWLVPGMASLALFAWLLTLVDAAHAGRAYAAYGGVYIVSAIAWLWLVEGARPDRWDALGAAVCLLGAAIIPVGPARDLNRRGAGAVIAFAIQLVPPDPRLNGRFTRAQAAVVERSPARHRSRRKRNE